MPLNSFSSAKFSKSKQKTKPISNLNPIENELYNSTDEGEIDSSPEECSEQEDVTNQQSLSFAEQLALSSSSKPKSSSSSSILSKHTFKRAEKHAPAEMSSKRPVKGARQVVHISKKPIRDPRFDDSCGNLNLDLFQKTYSFLDIKEKKGPQQELQELKKEWRRAEIEKLSKGIKTKPYFPKLSTLKMLAKVNQYQHLSDQTLEKKLEKKRKKMKSRDTKRMAQSQRRTAP
ncbi:rRNA biogenesis protein rrp36 [Coelomomyces lativittatus]|nr:rRNA biogenesis protein rrp36 [Coelomomyces lativittatus]KAJ1508683.1 rRNA biogenesis protein rrp36 [Coelomomyces lativittatus]KAJ1511829.1 rRNA biogenesis protein rrp36 [Coelomomyces lativittatus]